MSAKPPDAGLTYRERLRAAVTRYAPADLAEVMAFRRAMYGPSSVYAREDYFRWMYEACPQTSPDRPSLWLYRKDGRLEGLQGAYPTTLRAGGADHPALWSLDLMVTPAHQLRGIGSVLSEMPYEETGLALGLEISDDARKSFLRAGWLDAGTVPLYFRALDAGAVIRERAKRLRAAALGYAGTFAIGAVDLALGGALRVAGIRLEPVSAFDERSDRLWAEAAPSYEFLARRDATHLNWRFTRFPGQRYSLFHAYWRKRLIGYAVLRSGEWHGLPSGFLVDYLCLPSWTAALLGACLAEFRRQGVAAVYCAQSHEAAQTAFLALGFIRRDSSWRLMFRARDWPDSLRARARDQGQWFITSADADVDRPREGTVFAGGAAGVGQPSPPPP